MAEPRNKHDARCAVWLSDDPADGCDCRDADGHTRRYDPLTARRHFENEWLHLTYAQRVARLDDYSTRRPA